MLQKLQEEHAVWQNRNFPHAEKWECLVGVAEELGELAASVGNGAISADQHALCRDAIGDTVIYLTGFCTLNDINIEECTAADFDDVDKVMRTQYPSEVLRCLTVAVGLLSHGFLKRYQGIRNTESHGQNIRKSVSLIILGLHRMVSMLPGVATFDDIVLAAWDIVKQRDWTIKSADCNDAHTVNGPHKVNSSDGVIWMCVECPLHKKGSYA